MDFKTKDFVKEQSTFAYKNASRAFLALATLLLIYGLSFWKVISDDNFYLSVRGYNIENNIHEIETLIKFLPVGALDSFKSSSLDDIQIWKYHYGENIKKSQCDKDGALYYMFTPDEDTSSIDINRLLNSKVKPAFRILLKQDDARSADLWALMASQFIILGNEKDSNVLSTEYKNHDVPESKMIFWKKMFGRIDIRNRVPNKYFNFDPNKFYHDWFFQLRTILPYWTTFKDSIKESEGNFSLTNVQKISTYLKEKKPSFNDLKVTQGIEFRGTDAWRIFGILLSILIFMTAWFLQKARGYEIKYYSVENNNSEINSLSSISSGIFYFLEYYTPRNYLNKKEIKHQLRLKLWSWFFVVLLFLFLVGIPTISSIVVPLWMPVLIPKTFLAGPIYFLFIPIWVVINSIKLFRSVVFRSI